MAGPLAGRLRFSPAVLAHLGELLVPAIDVALAELVKNAYDADARECDIIVTGGQARTQRIVVEDDGCGMDLATLRDSWLLIGRSNKSHTIKTKRFHRIPLGDKGLGRLAALRLGRTVLLETRPSSEPGVAYRLEINWDRVDKARSVDDVKLSIQKLQTDEIPGTTITLSRLRAGLGLGEIEDLGERLALLQGPFEQARQFKVTLNHPRFQSLIAETGRQYLEDADFRLVARLSKTGTARFELIDWAGKPIASAPGPRRYHSAPATFELWMYLLDAQRFGARPRALGLSARKRWFDAFGGVYIFEGPLRVAPYGGPGDDWLGLNRKRVSSPEERPSTNNSVGRVKISPMQDVLQQKTDRLGYLENVEFRELKRFCEDALTWSATWRLKRAEERRRKSRQLNRAALEEARSDLIAQVEQLPAPDRKNIVQAADKLIALDSERDNVSLAERQLYRSLATIGILGTSFAHELDKPLNVAKDNLSDVREILASQHLPSRQLNLLASALNRIEPYVSIPLALIKREKRRRRAITLSETVREVFELYDPLITNAAIGADLSKADLPERVQGTNALLESIFANLITNSISAFDRPVATATHRKIRVTMRRQPTQLLIVFADNAGGIAGISADDIWLPGQTTTARGNGFGLTIVKDCVEDLRGTIDVDPLGSFGGAEFLISLPRVD